MKANEPTTAGAARPPLPGAEDLVCQMLQLASKHVTKLSAIAAEYRAPGFTEALDEAVCSYAGQVIDLIEAGWLR